MKKIEIEKPTNLHTPGDCAKLNRLSEEVGKQRTYSDGYFNKVDKLRAMVIILYTIIIIESIIIACKVF